MQGNGYSGEESLYVYQKRLHRHEGEAEMFYVLSGHPTLTDDGAEYTAQPGDCIVTRSGHSHAVRNNGGEPVELLACIAKD